MTRTKEYRDLHVTDPRSVGTTIAMAQSKTLESRVFYLIHFSAGWRPSGSAATWQDESYGVIFYEGNTKHGQTFVTLANAVARFELVTGKRVENTNVY